MSTSFDDLLAAGAVSLSVRVHEWNPPLRSLHHPPDRKAKPVSFIAFIADRTGNGEHHAIRTSHAEAITDVKASFMRTAEHRQKRNAHKDSLKTDVDKDIEDLI